MTLASAARLTLLALTTATAAAQSPPTQTPAAIPVPAPQKSAYESNPKFIAAMNQAADGVRTHKYVFAAEGYKRADKIAGGTCAKCLHEAYYWQIRLGEYKDAAALAVRLESISATPADKSVAVADQAQALLRAAGDKPKPAQLENVHALYQTALAAYPRNLPAQYADACVLARLGRLDEASKGFSACVASAKPNDPTRIRAQHFAENPSLALNKMAPAFTVTALDGNRFNLDEMSGRIVLIDFWATWCGPCMRELPHIQKIAREFAGQPLVIISVSWDDDEAKWKDFLSKNGMTWVQYRDADHSLSKSFGVEAIPHYFTIDSDGVLTAEMLGSGSDVEGKLRKLLARAKTAHPPAPQLAAGN